MSLSNEHPGMTILPASFPLKADGNIVTNYDCTQQKATQYSKRAIDDLVCCKTLQANGFHWSVT